MPRVRLVYAEHKLWMHFLGPRMAEDFTPSDLTRQLQEGVSESTFLDEFRIRYFCTTTVTMTDGLATWVEGKVLGVFLQQKLAEMLKTQNHDIL